MKMRRDRRKLFPTLTPPEEAVRKAKSILPRGLEAVTLNLYDAALHVLAEDVEARVSYPPEPRATADGYAVRHECVANASEDKPARLPVIERVRVGETPSKSIEGCEAVEVDTGAPIPPGADAVVPVEYTRERAGVVEVYRSVGFGENIAWPGSDIVEGEVVARRGQLLTPALIGALASAGVDNVLVYRKPVVCVAATGVELVPPGERLTPGHVYESNTYMLNALLVEDGFPRRIAGILPDEEEAVRRTLRECLRDADAMLFTGGTSAGPYDVVYRVLEEEGEVVAHGLKLKPGKPTIISIVDGKLAVGLPGNPVSALNVYRVVVRPLLWHLAGGEPPSPESRVEAVLALPAPGVKGRRLYQPVYLLEGAGGAPLAVPIEFESYMIVTYSKSDGYTIIPEDVHEAMPEGTKVDVTLHTPHWRASCYCIGEEYRGGYCSACKQVGGGTALAAKTLGKVQKGIHVLSPSHPAYRDPPSEYRVERVTRRLALILQHEPPRVVALPPPSTSIRFHLQALLAEKGYAPLLAIPAKNSKMAALLAARGYVDAALILEEDAKTYGLEPTRIMVEELVVAQRVSTGGGSSSPNGS